MSRLRLFPLSCAHYNHEPALTRFTACYAGCSFSNGTRKTNAAFGVACFSFVLIISHLTFQVKQ